MHRLLRDFAYYGRVAKELIFPRRCAVCATNIDNGYVCEQCRKEYLLQRQLPCCPREEYLAGQAAPLPTDVLYSALLLYKYEGVFKDVLHKIKFDGEAGCFALLPHVRVRGKHVLLCDDIYTTGSTFAEAAQVLLDAGAARVSALALCAAQANWE